LAGKTMLGVGRTVRNGRTVEYEFLRVHEDEQGRAVYTAVPSRQKETSFVATEVGAGVATFENATHDFPQRIIYRKMNEDSMVVRIEGERQGKQRSIEFQFVREPCPR
jgi:spore coat polysaccharide biosynthesis protein SpsF (cytidylyltransferase family)